jgi:integrase
MPNETRVKKDRAYTHIEISKLLEVADERYRVIILILASSGCRVGALQSLRLSNLQDNKLIIYENDREEYFTFITLECKRAIDAYLDMRLRYGEKLNDDSYLIREQFDIRNPGKPRQIKTPAIEKRLFDMTSRLGMRKNNVPIAHGFRKFFTTQLIQSKVNSEIREMLLGHKIGLASAYYRPTDEEMYQEYLKAVDLLTINEENRLKRKVQDLSNKTKENEYIIRGRLDEKDKQIKELMKKQEKTDLLIQSLIDTGHLKAKTS